MEDRLKTEQTLRALIDAWKRTRHSPHEIVANVLRRREWLDWSHWTAALFVIAKGKEEGDQYIAVTALGYDHGAESLDALQTLLRDGNFDDELLGTVVWALAHRGEASERVISEAVRLNSTGHWAMAAALLHLVKSTHGPDDPRVVSALCDRARRYVNASGKCGSFDQILTIFLPDGLEQLRRLISEIGNEDAHVAVGLAAGLANRIQELPRWESHGQDVLAEFHDVFVKAGDSIRKLAE